MDDVEIWNWPSVGGPAGGMEFRLLESGRWDGLVGPVFGRVSRLDPGGEKFAGRFDGPFPAEYQGLGVGPEVASWVLVRGDGSHWPAFVAPALPEPGLLNLFCLVLWWWSTRARP